MIDDAKCFGLPSFSDGQFFLKHSYPLFVWLNVNLFGCFSCTSSARWRLRNSVVSVFRMYIVTLFYFFYMVHILYNMLKYPSIYQVSTYLDYVSTWRATCIICDYKNLL